jgi:hypothetical protein
MPPGSRFERGGTTVTQPRPHAGDDRDWIAAALRSGTDTTQALARFDRLETVPVEAMRGRWRGAELRTGHPLDGMLAAFGWAGKHVCNADAVYPLLFEHRGETVAIDPRWLPVRLAARLRVQRSAAARALFDAALPLQRKRRVEQRARRPCARLRMIEFRGRVGAAMLYDALPIIDVFRRLDRDRMLGLMDCRYFDAPFFFVLERA